MTNSQRRITVQPPQLTLNGTPLDQVHTFKYLGVLSLELSCSANIESIYNENTCIMCLGINCEVWKLFLFFCPNSYANTGASPKQLFAIICVPGTAANCAAVVGSIVATPGRDVLAAVCSWELYSCVCRSATDS